MLLNIQYTNGGFDYIHHSILDQLLNSRRIKKFFRPNEKRWIIIGVDPVRSNRDGYSGKERRQ